MTVKPNPALVIGIGETNDKSKGIACGALASWCSINLKIILAEFISTMFLVLFGCMSCIPIDNGSSPVATSMYAAFGFGLIVLFNIQTFGHISGAHMNPAVTAAAVIYGKMSFFLGVGYVIAQFLGAIAGYGILMGVSHVNLTMYGVCITQLHENLTVYQGLAIEVLLTAGLALINCAVWDPVNKDSQECNSLKFGFTIAGLSIVGGPITGTSMNPARTFGPALWTGIWTDHWVYWVGPFVGSGIATILYKLIWLTPASTKNSE